MTDNGFTRAELRQLPPSDLRDLLMMADGETDMARALALGLDPSSPTDRQIVAAALDGAPVPFSPPIGAGQDGVRSDLTPDEAADEGLPQGLGPGAGRLLGPLSGSPNLADIEAAIAESAQNQIPFMAGTFAAYGTPTGDVVLVYEDQAGEVTRTVFPRRMLRMVFGLAKSRGLLGRFRG